MDKKRNIKPRGETDAIDQISNQLNVDEHIANLLVQRGVDSFKKAEDFFRPGLDMLHDPFLMKDMNKAVQRLDEALSNNEKILIYGDYDVDGTTSVALVTSFLRKYHTNVDFYIPDRYEEGYGISRKGIDYAYSKEFTLVISLDCGIKAVNKIAYALEKQIDFIVCDHHLPGDQLPPAYAILDPKRHGDQYPCKDLSGCGVGFKLIQAFALHKGIPFEELHELLDLVAISIASDIVPVTGENRVLAYHGLKRLNKYPRPGIEAILQYSNIERRPNVCEDDHHVFNKELTISDLIFVIGPRINAAGRMKDANQSVELLICKDPHFSQRIGVEINENNEARKTLDLSITDQATSTIETDSRYEDKRALIIFDPGWHKGVIGIVASRLVEKFYKPTIVLTSSANGLITGSARSIRNFDIYEAIAQSSHLLENFGGHKYAAGLSLKPENLEAFARRVESYAHDNLAAHQMVPTIDVDAELPLEAITPRFLRILKQFAPFGPGNMPPTFITRKITDNGNAKIVGKNHIKFTVAHPENYNMRFHAIAFKQGHQWDKVRQMKPFDICYQVEENCWNGKKSTQLNIKDICFSDNH